MKIEIKNRWSGEVVFSIETDTWRLAVEAAIKADANLYDADLRGADLCGADLCGADLCGADLCGANLCGANLRGADLCGANLRGADLCGADLCGADLCGADLCGANLCGANLRGADLRGADLRDANLYDADLRDANLRDANLRDAKNLKFFPLSITGHRHYLQTTQDGELQIGCQVHSFEDWAKIAESLGVENQYSDLDIEIYKLHIAHIEKVSRLLWAAKKETVSA